MVITLYSILLLTCVFAFFENRIADIRKVLYASLCFILIMLAAFRTVGIDNDSENYEFYFRNYDEPLLENIVEFSFRFLSEFFSNIFDDVHIIFFIYALFGVTIKFVAFQRLTPLMTLAIITYIGHYYILHECNQIRAGVASALFLLSVTYIANRQLLRAVCLMLLALFFHYSSLILLPLLFLSNKDMQTRQRMMWALSIPVGYLVYFLGISLSSVPIPYISEKMEIYEALKDLGFDSDLNVFSAVMIVRNLIFLYLLYMYDTIRPYNPYLSLMLKIMGISLFAVKALAGVPVIAMRISELYGIVEIILFVGIYYTIKPSWLSKVIVMSISIVLFSISILCDEITKIM